MKKSHAPVRRVSRVSFSVMTATALMAVSFVAATSSPARAELKLCGFQWGKPGELQKKFTEQDKLPEIHRDGSYVAYQDKKTSTVWTFTLPGIPAHPAVVCRRPKKDGDVITLDMDYVCLGVPGACDDLIKQFQHLNDQMSKAMNKKQ